MVISHKAVLFCFVSNSSSDIVVQFNFSHLGRLTLESITLTRDVGVVVHQGVHIIWYFRLWTSFTLTATKMDWLQTNSGKTVLVFHFVSRKYNPVIVQVSNQYTTFHPLRLLEKCILCWCHNIQQFTVQTHKCGEPKASA